jgi:hypothetical protein
VREERQRLERAQGLEAALRGAAPEERRALGEHLVLHERDLAAAQDQHQRAVLAARVPEALQLRRHALLRLAQVGELVEHDDEALARGALREEAQRRAPVGELDVAGEGVAELAGDGGAERAQVVAVADLRGEEVHRLAAGAELLEQLGLADPASAVEHEQLRPACLGELLQESELALSAEERGLDLESRAGGGRGHGEIVLGGSIRASIILGLHILRLPKVGPGAGKGPLVEARHSRPTSLSIPRPNPLRLHRGSRSRRTARPATLAALASGAQMRIEIVITQRSLPLALAPHA